MTRETIHSVHDDRGNFRETTTGDAPSSVTVSFNAKGVAQLEVKAYYADAATMTLEAAKDLENTILNLVEMLHTHDIQVAGFAGIPQVGEATR